MIFFCLAFTIAALLASLNRSDNTIPWEEPTQEELLDLSGPCTIERYMDDSLGESDVELLMQRGEPFIYRRVRAHTARFAAALATRSAFLARFGGVNVTLASSNTHSYARLDTTMREYVAVHLPRQRAAQRATRPIGQDVFYLFGDTPAESFGTLLSADYVPPRGLRHADTAVSFGIGTTGSGVPFHSHGAVAAETFGAGRKRWFVAPPHAKPDFDPVASSLQWLRKAQQQQKERGEAVSAARSGDAAATLLECTLGEGEVLYVPANYWHATLNIGDIAFIANFIR